MAHHFFFFGSRLAYIKSTAIIILKKKLQQSHKMIEYSIQTSFISKTFYWLIVIIRRWMFSMWIWATIIIFTTRYWTIFSQGSNNIVISINDCLVCWWLFHTGWKNIFMEGIYNISCKKQNKNGSDLRPVEWGWRERQRIEKKEENSWKLFNKM